MATNFTLLLVEDNAQDAELVLETLRGAGFDPQCRQVDTREDYVRELTASPDLILSDFSLPQFDGKTALQLLKATGMEIPFIIVSGCIGEEMAVECMKAGAADYLLKDRLGRLPHAVSQALDRKRLLEEKRQAEQRLFLETFHDPLTGLPNRVLFLDRVNRVILRNRRDATRLFAVVYLSLEGFQIVYNSLGPSAKDRLLLDVSRRILMRVRSADTLARLDGEDFVFLLDNLKSDRTATRLGPAGALAVDLHAARVPVVVGSRTAHRRTDGDGRRDGRPAPGAGVDSCSPGASRSGRSTSRGS